MPCWYYFSRPSNVACHDLTTYLRPPAYLVSLLGLGLKFIPKPRYTTHRLDRELERLKRNLYCAYVFAPREGEESEPFDSKYHLPTNYCPPRHHIPIEIRARYGAFCNALISKFKKRHCRPNLLPNQRKLLSLLQRSDQFIVGYADKNLGPYIIERDRYVYFAYRDHLSNKDTYKEL